jgi:hypothetical protein
VKSFQTAQQKRIKARPFKRITKMSLGTTNDLAFIVSDIQFGNSLFCCPPSQIMTSIEEGQIWADVAFYFTMPDV